MSDTTPQGDTPPVPPAPSAYPGSPAPDASPYDQTPDAPAHPAPDAPAYGQSSDAPAYDPTPPAYGQAASYDQPAPPPYGQPPAAPYGQPAYGQPQAPYGQSPYGQPQAPYGQYGQAAPAYGQGYGYAPTPKTSALAIVSLVASIAGFIWILPLVGSVVGVITGHMALSRLKTSGENGRGIALAGTIVGWVGLAFAIIGGIILISIFAWAAAESNRYGY